MWDMLWPAVMVVLSNVFYNISQKSVPENVNAFGSLMVTYLIAAALTFLLFIATAGSGSLNELNRLNWTSFVLAVAIVGLETGYIYLYRAGWKVSVASVTCNIALAVVLVFVGVLLYRETISLKQIIGMVLCSLGLFLITA